MKDICCQIIEGKFYISFRIIIFEYCLNYRNIISWNFCVKILLLIVKTFDKKYSKLFEQNEKLKEIMKIIGILLYII